MRTDSWVIIADDLTGAADAAVGFTASADAVVVIDSDSAWPAAPVVAVNTETRHSPTDVARRRVASVASRVGAARIYKKMDSLGRGPLAAEVQGILGAVRQHDPTALAIIAPAFPSLGRTVVDGRILLDGVPGVDLASLIAADGLRQAIIRNHADADDLLRRIDALRGNVDAVIVDATSDTDLRSIAHAMTETAEWAIPVGSGGLAAELGRLRHGGTVPAVVPRLDEHGVLFVVGSYADSSRSQLDALRRAGVHHLELDHERLDATDGADGLRRGLRGGHAVISPDRAALVDPARAEEVAAALAVVVASALPDVTALVISGGHTARAVLAQLGVASFRVLGEVERGIILNEIPGRPLRLITKSGSFGDSETLASLVRG